MADVPAGNLSPYDTVPQVLARDCNMWDDNPDWESMGHPTGREARHAVSL
jgi:hypothetical protein